MQCAFTPLDWASWCYLHVPGLDELVLCGNLFSVCSILRQLRISLDLDMYCMSPLFGAKVFVLGWSLAPLPRCLVVNSFLLGCVFLGRFDRLGVLG